MSGESMYTWTPEGGTGFPGDGVTAMNHPAWVTGS